MCRRKQLQHDTLVLNEGCEVLHNLLHYLSRIKRKKRVFHNGRRVDVLLKQVEKALKLARILLKKINLQYAKQIASKRKHLKANTEKFSSRAFASQLGAAAINDKAATEFLKNKIDKNVRRKNLSETLGSFQLIERRKAKMKFKFKFKRSHTSAYLSKKEQSEKEEEKKKSSSLYPEREEQPRRVAEKKHERGRENAKQK